MLPTCILFILQKDLKKCQNSPFLTIISGCESANGESVRNVRVFVRKKRAKKAVEALVKEVKPEIVDHKV